MTGRPACRSAGVSPATGVDAGETPALLSLEPVRAHQHPVRVYYEDTDAGGMVYHANYLKFAERGRTEFLRSLGHSHTSAREESGIAFVVRRCTADFLVPARLDDALTVVTSIVAVRGALLTLRQEVRRGDALLVGIDIDVACIGREGRARRLPPALRAMLLSK